MAEKILKEILFFNYEENLSSDFKLLLKYKNFKSYLKQGKDLTKFHSNLFYFVLYISKLMKGMSIITILQY